MFIYIISNLSHIQPDGNDDGENSVPFDNVRRITPNFNQPPIIKNKSLRRRETIDTVQGRQYRTALQQLQDLFWPARTTHHTIINNNQLNEHEQ
ncbi:unnamed protein product [Rotaria sp. Silwood1]|nr:unnamed protein product [Rotaria sp. Silwood1]CAF3804458.1 unnamed protein product [Rotaria sp. Silwood1]CAF3880956.1 unnamed protein product [Rotaria sp. Silwood1]CAF4692243.1 unnamed protein product [Rotaria sp. Silwood1]CAF4841988.1 unnamed protein product [Rotaria sp. Silwood1]